MSYKYAGAAQETKKNHLPKFRRNCWHQSHFQLASLLCSRLYFIQLTLPERLLIRHIAYSATVIEQLRISHKNFKLDGYVVLTVITKWVELSLTAPSMSGVTGWNVSSSGKEDTLHTVSEWIWTILCVSHCLFISFFCSEILRKYFIVQFLVHPVDWRWCSSTDMMWV